MEKFKVIIYGCGYWGKNIIRCLEQIPAVDIVGVCDTNLENLSKYTKFNTYNSYRETKDIDFDIGFVITRADSHFEICKFLLENGKHVFVEKPMTLSSHDAYDLIEISRLNNKNFCVDHTFLFSPEVRAIKSLLLNNINNIKLFESNRVNNGPLMKDIDVIFDLCPHDFSIINYLFPFKIKDISCHAFKVFSNFEKANIKISYCDSEIICNICVSWLENIKSRKIKLLGEYIFIENDSAIDNNINLNHKLISLDKDSEPLMSELLHFINCCDKNIKSNIIDASLGAKVIKMIEVARISASKNGEPINLQ